MDANNMLSQGNLIYDDCIVIGASKTIGLRYDAGKVVLDHEISIDNSCLSDIGYNFSLEVNGSVYAGGEASNHGSYGFFLKKTNEKLDWALMALESNPFARVSVSESTAQFFSTSGDVWVVPNNDITEIYVIKKKKE